MKILAAILVVLLLACVGGAAYFYIYMYQPMVVDLKSGKSEFDKAKAELKRYKDREKNESAWIGPAINDLNSILSDELKTNKAEVLTFDNRLAVSIAEQTLYMPGSKTFTNDSRQLLAKLDSLFRNDSFKNKNIYVGNTTQTVPAQTTGRKKSPAKDARTLSAERSMELIKYLEKRGVNQDALAAVAYASKPPDLGSKIKDRKILIIIENPATTLAAKQAASSAVQSKQTPTPKDTSTASSATATAQPLSKQTATVKPASAATSTTSSVSQTQPKPIPILPAKPKAN
jgi:outer membrane protein OmpA-like peptidoglycan-associated protein